MYIEGMMTMKEVLYMAYWQKELIEKQEEYFVDQINEII